MDQEFKPKHFRLTNPALFKLDKHKVYLASETPVGYVLKIDDDNRMGLPKICVENNKRLFVRFIEKEHREFKRTRINRVSY